MYWEAKEKFEETKTDRSEGKSSDESGLDGDSEILYNDNLGIEIPLDERVEESPHSPGSIHD